MKIMVNTRSKTLKHDVYHTFFIYFQQQRVKHLKIMKWAERNGYVGNRVVFSAWKRQAQKTVDIAIKHKVVAIARNERQQSRHMLAIIMLYNRRTRTRKTGQVLKQLTQ